jgi:hypothetical protein
VFLDAASGQALGTPAAPRGQVVGTGGNLIGNALLDGSTVLDPAVIAAAQNGETLPTTPTSTTSTTSQQGVAPVGGATGTLPSPTTR